MKKLPKHELYVLKAYLALPLRKLLDHKFEVEENYIAGYVSRFLKGERFDKEFTAFSKEKNEVITKNFNNDDGKDLLTAFLTTKAVCNIMNKYKKIID